MSERVVRENGKFYEIIKARDGSQRRFTNVELEFGFAMRKDKDYSSYIKARCEEYYRIIKKRQKSEKTFDDRQICELIKAAGSFLGK